MGALGGGAFGLVVEGVALDEEDCAGGGVGAAFAGGFTANRTLLVDAAMGGVAGGVFVIGACVVCGVGGAVLRMSLCGSSSCVPELGSWAPSWYVPWSPFAST
jgi:hypothetical protein